MCNNGGETNSYHLNTILDKIIDLDRKKSIYNNKHNNYYFKNWSNVKLFLLFVYYMYINIVLLICFHYFFYSG